MPEGKDLIIDNKFIMEGGVYRRRANRTAVPATPTISPADNDEDDVATDGEKREVIVLDHEKE